MCSRYIGYLQAGYKVEPVGLGMVLYWLDSNQSYTEARCGRLGVSRPESLCRNEEEGRDDGDAEH